MTSISEIRLSRRTVLGLGLGTAATAALAACQQLGLEPRPTATPEAAKPVAAPKPAAEAPKPAEVAKPADKPAEQPKPAEAPKPAEKPKPDPTAVFEQRVTGIMRERQANPTGFTSDDAVHDEARRRLGTPVATTKPEAPAPAKPAEVAAPAKPTEVPTKELSGTKIKVFGMPDKPQGEVDTAKGIFKKQTEVLNFLLADPGGLLVGADFVDTTAKGNPYGSNPGATELYKAEGSIRFWDPVTEEVYRWSPPAFDNVPEGGFRTWSLGEGRIAIPRDSAHSDPNMKEFVIDLPYEQGNNYIVVVRGLYADGKQDSDRNRTAEVTKYKPGHAWSAMYQSRLKSNLGFVSEDQIMQQAATSHMSGNNCGAEGCSKLTLYGLDTNTGKYEVWTQTMNRDEALADWKNARKGWTKIAGN